MNRPAEEDDPEDGSKHEVRHGHEKAALQQLAESGKEEAAKCGNHVAG
jgi:hypothetical protein